MPALQVAAKQRALEDALCAHRPRAAGAAAAADPRAGVGLPVSRAAVGAPRREEGRRAGRLPRAQVELRRRHDVVPRAAAQDLRPAARTARARSAALSMRDRCRRSSGGGRRAPSSRRYVLVLRILEPLAPADEAALARVRRRARRRVLAAARRPGTVAPFHPARPRRSPTRCPSSTSRMPFSPTEFTQVNRDQPRARAARGGAARPAARASAIADFFCGLGNFTLPIARRGAQVDRRRGQRRARARAPTENAALQRPGRNARVSRRPTCSPRRPKAWRRSGRSTRSLIDPPREGAIELVKALPRATARAAADRLRLVQPGDARARRRGARARPRLRLAAAGVVNMFPHTAHVESIALFAR